METSWNQIKSSRNFMESDGIFQELRESRWQLESFIIQPSSEVKIQIVFICKYYNLRISFSSTLQFFDKEKLFDRPRNIQFLPFIVLLRIKSIQTQLTRNILLLFFITFFVHNFYYYPGIDQFSSHLFSRRHSTAKQKYLETFANNPRLNYIHVGIFTIHYFFFILCFVFFVVYRDFKNFF